MATKLEQKYSKEITGSRRGQVMVEYIIVAGMLIMCIAAISLFLNTFKSNSYRVVELSASEYP